MELKTFFMNVIMALSSVVVHACFEAFTERYKSPVLVQKSFTMCQKKLKLKMRGCELCNDCNYRYSNLTTYCSLCISTTHTIHKTSINSSPESIKRSPESIKFSPESIKFSPVNQ